MAALIEKLGFEFAKAAQNADEAWVAVALLNPIGLHTISQSVRQSTTVHFLVGIHLPTSPEALKQLLQLQQKHEWVVKIHTSSAFFHPKMYLCRHGKNFVGFVGSANATDAGFERNIELSLCIEGANARNLVNWFLPLFDQAQTLTSDFIKSYEVEFAKRQKRDREELAQVEKLVEQLRQPHEAKLAKRNLLVRQLREYRASENYLADKKNKAESVKHFRNWLGYTRDFQNIDLDAFYSHWDMGHIIPVHKSKVQRHIKKFAKQLTMLCDENLDLAYRFNAAISGKYKVPGVGINIITKVLAVHAPKKYFVMNTKSMSALAQYGLELPYEVSAGQKYKSTCQFLQNICKETKIESMPLLDAFLYGKANE